MTFQVIVQTFPERMDAIARLIQSLDEKTKEVLIVSKIIKVTVSDDYDAELKWEAFFRNISFLRPLHDSDDSVNFLGNHGTDVFARTGTTFSNDLGTVARTAVPAAGAKNVLTENLFFGFLGKDNSFEGVLNYLRTIGDTRIISNPRLTVINNQEAKIHVGDREAYITSTVTSGTSTNTTAEAVTFVDVGIQLSVTPTINDEGFITMRIKPSISSVSRTLVTSQNNRIPIIDTSEAETTVMVKDGTTIILAGLRKDERIGTVKRIPFLGDIPVLGRMFRNVNDEKKRTELLILLTPTIVTGEQFIVEQPIPPEEGIKPYREYSSIDAKAEKKSGLPQPYF
jgi:type II secretory pathway component GspD/PulD (secretin)